MPVSATDLGGLRRHNEQTFTRDPDVGLHHGWIVILPGTNGRSLAHRLISKVNTAAQILLVLMLIYYLSGFPLSTQIPPLLIDIMVYLVAVTTLASGVAYVFIWSRRARHEYKVKLP